MVFSHRESLIFVTFYTNSEDELDEQFSPVFQENQNTIYFGGIIVPKKFSNKSYWEKQTCSLSKISNSLDMPNGGARIECGEGASAEQAVYLHNGQGIVRWISFSKSGEVVSTYNLVSNKGLFGGCIDYNE